MTYDLAIIGGGIAGAAVARDAALRGVRTVLFEKNEFGSGTSSKSSKLVHGGLRYLETAWNALKEGRVAEFWKNFRFVFLSLREARILEKIAPDLVKPIALILPVYDEQKRGRWTVYLGVFLYWLLSRLTGNKRGPRFFSKTSLLREVPELKAEGLLGGVRIWDHTADDALLVKRTAASAVRHGAQALEHVEVTGYRRDEQKKVHEIEVRLGNETRLFRARNLINASGPWVDKLRERGKERDRDLLFPLAGSHLVFKKFVEHSLILEAVDHRVFFVIRHGDLSRVGTTERVYADPDTLKVTEEEVDYLLGALKKYFPQKNLTRRDIVGRDAGIRPLARPKNASSPTQISREHEISIGPHGVIHVLGVKLTDHRRAAQEIVDRIAPGTKSKTARVPL